MITSFTLKKTQPWTPPSPKPSPPNSRACLTPFTVTFLHSLTYITQLFKSVGWCPRKEALHLVFYGGLCLPGKEILQHPETSGVWALGTS